MSTPAAAGVATSSLAICNRNGFSGLAAISFPPVSLFFSMVAVDPYFSVIMYLGGNAYVTFFGFPVHGCPYTRLP